MDEKKLKEQERILLELASSGDIGAYEKLVEKYYQKVFSLCFGILGNKEDAEDVCQEVFIKVFINLKKFKGKSGFYTWIYSIARNYCIDFIRKKRRSANYEYKDNIMSKNEEKVEKNPFWHIRNKEIATIIHNAISALPDDQREVLVLREINGLSYNEIAKVLKCSEGTVMSRLHYARKKVAEKVSKIFKNGNGGYEL